MEISPLGMLTSELGLRGEVRPPQGREDKQKGPESKGIEMCEYFLGNIDVAGGAADEESKTVDSRL